MAAGAPSSHESRRTVTVVFADMVGFTALGERLDEESLRRVMDGFYVEMREAIEGEAGTLAKFIGDAVLAVWGTPEVREDDARRAVRAAEAMRRSLAALNEDLERRWAVRVGMRTGVNTGEVVVDPARPADLLVGDTLNVAARLEQAAADGEVLIGPETQRLVRDHAVLEAVEPLPLKGKSSPMPAWRLVDGSGPDRRAAARIEAPLVGRDAELGRLRASFDAAVATRSCRLVSVIGSPGLGKTRLVAELVRSVRGEATVLEGHCEATGEGITFQPVAEVIRMAAAIDEEDPSETARAKIDALLPEGAPDRERVVDRAAALLGLAPATSTQETFWAVRLLLEGVARERPVVLVYEDIHWGEPTFLDLVEHLAEWVRDVPLLIVALARPELREVRPALADKGGAVADAIALEPLPPGDSRVLVDRLLGASELPPALAQRVLETAEGNPLFLGEMLRMLADDGVLTREGGTWVAAGDTAGVTVPPTIQALLAARIERLGKDERGVVERASVIGHQFYRGAVAELTPAEGQGTVDGSLVTLQRKELVQPEEMMWLDERVYRFHHVLIRDAAYRSLLKEARADLHERFAAWLERKAVEQVEVIAFHLEQAHLYRLELGPLDDRGLALGAAAGARLHSAGRRALEREDLPAAINLLRRALAPLPREDRPTVLVDLAEALLSAGDTVAAEGVVEGLGLGADEAEDEQLGAWATAFAGQLDNLTGAGHVRETVEAATEAAEILARAGDGAGEAKAHHVVAGAEALLGQVAACEAALDRALVAARAAGDNRRVTAVLAGAPRAALWGPAPIVRASGRCLDVVRILRMTPGTRHVEAAALRCQAVLEAMRGRADAARAIIAGCRATFEELGLTFELLETGVYSGIVELLGGEAGAAEEELRQARDGFVALHVDGGAAQAAALLARALLEQGRDEEALEATRFAEERGGEDLKTTIAWLGVRAEALAHGGALDEALSLAERAWRLAEPTDALADKADALMALARVRVAAGQAEAARGAAEQARALYAEKDHAVGVARAAGLAGVDELAPIAEESRTDDPEGIPITPLAHRWLDAHARRDWEAMRALFADDYTVVDQRQLGWDAEMWRGADRAVEQQRSLFDAGVDYEVETRTTRAEGDVTAGVITFRDPDGGWEIEFATVYRVRDGLFARSEMFDPADDAGITRRFEELVCECELEQTAAGRAQLAVQRAYNERDWEKLARAYRDDFVNVEHRRVSADVHNREQMLAVLKSWAEMSPDSRIVFFRVVEQAEHVVALVYGGCGTVDGAEIEIAFGAVQEERDGRLVRQEVFEPDDREELMRRFDELVCEHELERTPAGLAYAEYVRCFNERDWEAFRGVFDDEYVGADHRRIPSFDAQGPDEFMSIMQAWGEMSPNGRLDTHRVLAHAEHLLALVMAGRGTVDGADWEIGFGMVLGERDGRIVRIDGFEPEDEDGIMRRFGELALDRELEQTAAGRTHLDYIRALNERDWQALRTLCHDDFVLEDHRQLAGWDAETADQFVMTLQAWVDMSPASSVRDLRIDAQAEHLLAGVIAGGGLVDGAEWEIQFGFVLEARDGRMLRIDAFEPEDFGGIKNRFDQRARELELEGTPVGRLHLEYLRLFNERDWEAVARLHDEEFMHVEHTRATAGSEAETADELIAGWRAWTEMAPDARMVNVRIEAQTEHVIAAVLSGFGTVDGAEFELTAGFVGKEREGRYLRTETFDPEDLDGMLACFERLRTPAADLDTPALRTVYRYMEIMRRRDWPGLADCFTPGFRFVDRRQVGWGELDRDAMIATSISVGDVGDFDVTARVLAARGDTVAYELTWTGTSEEGVTWQDLMALVNVGHDALAYGERFDSDDEEGLLARFAELTADGVRPVHPLVRVMTEQMVRQLNERRWDEYRAATADDFSGRDLRLISEDEMHGPDERLALAKRVADVAQGVRMRPELLAGEVLPGGLLISAAITAYTADVPDGDGQSGLLFDMRAGSVGVTRDGKMWRTDILDDDPEAVLAHYDAVKAEL